MRQLFLLSFVILFLPAAFCGPTDLRGTPVPDRCEDPNAQNALGLEIGHYSYLEFESITEGAILPLIDGAQGSSMVGIRLRIPFLANMMCIEQKTSLIAEDGEDVNWVDIPVRLYPDEDGMTLSTRTIWLPVNYQHTESGDAFMIEVVTELETIQRRVYIGNQ